MIFVNLPVADLQRSRDFFTAVGYEIDERMSNEVAVGVRLGDNLYAMLLVPEFFARFHDHETARPGTSETLVCLSAEDRQQVDEIVDRAAAAGATDVRTGDDQEYMYGRSYTDPDGHVWEIMWMDVAAATQAGALGE
ncbi:hypothetical protein ADJ73_14020 [Arsenicicoccus sp. oral taxon 190]|nr:hypothetical protein ADJ73_14020 [Arsenicicoccus sp. oral taxon 190]